MTWIVLHRVLPERPLRVNPGQQPPVRREYWGQRQAYQGTYPPPRRWGLLIGYDFTPLSKITRDYGERDYGEWRSASDEDLSAALAYCRRRADDFRSLRPNRRNRRAARYYDTWAGLLLEERQARILELDLGGEA